MKKDIALLIVIILAAAAVIKGVDIQSVDEYYSLHSDDTANAAHTVTLTVDCSDILDNYYMLDKNLRDECYVPSDGCLLYTSPSPRVPQTALLCLRKYMSSVRATPPLICWKKLQGAGIYPLIIKAQRIIFTTLCMSVA